MGSSLLNPSPTACFQWLIGFNMRVFAFAAHIGGRFALFRFHGVSLSPGSLCLANLPLRSPTRPTISACCPRVARLLIHLSQSCWCVLRVHCGAPPAETCRPQSADSTGRGRCLSAVNAFSGYVLVPGPLNELARNRKILICRTFADLHVSAEWTWTRRWLRSNVHQVC